LLAIGLRLDEEDGWVIIIRDMVEIDQVWGEVRVEGKDKDLL
jgi:hypothetical protein